MKLDRGALTSNGEPTPPDGHTWRAGDDRATGWWKATTTTPLHLRPEQSDQLRHLLDWAAANGVTPVVLDGITLEWIAAEPDATLRAAGDALAEAAEEAECCCDLAASGPPVVHEPDCWAARLDAALVRWREATGE